jgi:predicted transcriptional regulator
MSVFSEDLINKSMLYVSHPCADIIRNCKITRFAGVKIMETNNTHYNKNVFCISDDTNEQFEKQSEAKVVERNIYNKFQIRCITEDKLKHLKQINYFIFLYLHFNKMIIDGFIV